MLLSLGQHLNATTCTFIELNSSFFNLRKTYLYFRETNKHSHTKERGNMILTQRYTTLTSLKKKKGI